MYVRWGAGKVIFAGMGINVSHFNYYVNINNTEWCCTSSFTKVMLFHW